MPKQVRAVRQLVFERCQAARIPREDCRIMSCYSKLMIIDLELSTINRLLICQDYRCNFNDPIASVDVLKSDGDVKMLFAMVGLLLLQYCVLLLLQYKLVCRPGTNQRGRLISTDTSTKYPPTYTCTTSYVPAILDSQRMQ